MTARVIVATAVPRAMRPALLKLGGSVITDKGRTNTLHRTVLKRLCNEAARAAAPLVLLHGAGSFGHPQAARHRIQEGVGDRNRAGVSDVLCAVGLLHAEVVRAANDAGLRPVSVPLHLSCRSESDAVEGFPIARVENLLEEGHTPVLPGTLIRDRDHGWRVLSADETMQMLADELQPRLALFATDVDGIYDRHPDAPGAKLHEVVDRTRAEAAAAFEEGPGEDVSGRMRGKLLRALAMAQVCPVRIVNGTVRGRVHDALRGKQVKGTRVG